MLQTLAIAVILAPSLMVAMVFHELAHGLVAKWLGDTTASERGRLTLNPLRHVSHVGTVLIPSALTLAGGPFFGWAKPVPIRKRRLRNPRFGLMAVAAAGPLSNIGLALIGALALGLAWVDGANFDPARPFLPLLFSPAGEPAWVMSALYFFVVINLLIAVLNALPIPPLDGSHFVAGLLPKGLRTRWNRLQRYGFAALIGLVVLSWLTGGSWIFTALGAPLLWVIDAFITLALWVSQAV
ncbi:MAG: site-2 protease family protein [Pseudomonadota bacterium]